MKNIKNCVTDCLTGDDKINTLSLKGQEDEAIWRDKNPGITCNAPSFFAKLILFGGVLNLAISSTNSSTIPKGWLTMSEFLSYNDAGGQETPAHILDSLTYDTDMTIFTSACITVLSFISFIATKRNLS